MPFADRWDSSPDARGLSQWLNRLVVACKETELGARRPFGDPTPPFLAQAVALSIADLGSILAPKSHRDTKNAFMERTFVTVLAFRHN